ncbi:hypothetical protein ACLOJK_029372 [Asimina triloba]
MDESITIHQWLDPAIPIAHQISIYRLYISPIRAEPAACQIAETQSHGKIRHHQQQMIGAPLAQVALISRAAGHERSCQTTGAAASMAYAVEHRLYRRAS